jgi:tetratricopeptide (TPR) repeat protein
MGGFAGPRPVEYGQYGQSGVNAIYAAPAPQIYAPQQAAPAPQPAPTTRRGRRAALKAAQAQAQAQPMRVMVQPAPPMMVQPGLVMPQTGGVYYAPPPPTTLRGAPGMVTPAMAAPAQPVAYAPGYAQPQQVVVGGYAPGYLQQPMQVQTQQLQAQPQPQPPAPRRRVETVERREVVRQEVVRQVVSAPAPTAEPSSAGTGGGACSLGPSGTAAELSPQRAVAAGWCLVNARRPAEATIAFDRAIAAGGKTGQDAAYGKSIAMIQSNDPKAAAAAAAGGGVSGKRRDDIGKMALEQRIFQTYDAGDYTGALRLLRQRAAFAPETRDLTLMRAWSNYQMGDLDEAKRLFKMLDDQMSTKQSRSGLAAIDEKRTRMQY